MNTTNKKQSMKAFLYPMQPFYKLENVTERWEVVLQLIHKHLGMFWIALFED